MITSSFGLLFWGSFCIGMGCIPINAFALLPTFERTSEPRKLKAFTSEVLEQTVLPKETDVIGAQQQAEEAARRQHDNFAMNALFVNVQEHPNPTQCKVFKGPLPQDLPAGCLMRIGPNGATKDEGWLDGDGLIQCVVIPEDKTSDPIFSSTYVETRGRSLEVQSKGSSIGGKRFRGTLGAAPYGLPMLQNLMQNGLDFQTTVVQKDTCNTAMAVSGQRVLALMEQSPPSEIQISKNGRLQTVASMCRLDGAVTDAPITGGSFGAHGRTDPKSGERVHVSYSSSTKPFVRIDTFADDWKLVSSLGVDVPAPVMIHDCAITDQFVVLLDFPLTIRPRRFLRDAFPVEYEPGNGARIGLTARRESSEGSDATTQWFDVDEGVVLHVANAFEQSDGKVVVHGFKSLPKGESSYILDYTPAFLHQWILDPITGTVVDDRCLNPYELVEFPIVEDRLVGSNPGCIYGLQTSTIGGPIYECKTPQAGVLLNSVIKFSTKEETVGEVVGKYTLEHGWHFCSEPTVVTKTNSGAGHYVLLYATFIPERDSRDKNYDEMARDGSSLKSRLIILDGDTLSSGPVSIVDLPYHMNYGLHSLYLPWDKLK